jgi:hypothetical protein
MAQAIEESEIGPRLVYHLGKNRALAQKLAGMTPVKAGIEIARIEAQLVAEASKPKQRVSNAPEPVTTVSARGSPDDGYRDNMTPSEFNAWRAKGGGKRK